MSLMDNSQILSLFSDDLSLWGHLHEGSTTLHLDTSSRHLKEGKSANFTLDTFDPLSPESDVSSDDPMPDWMSEKIPLSAWLGDEEDVPTPEMMTIPEPPVVKATLGEAEELLNQLLVDVGIPTTPASPGEDPSSAEALLALAPESPLSLESLASLGSSPVSPQSSEQTMAKIDSEQTVLSIPEGGDLEAQALALLDMLSGTANVDQDMLDTQVITINLPLSSLEDQSASHAPASPESLLSSPSSPESLPSTPEPTPVKRTKSKPRLKNASPIDRKTRKRHQNKEAATRYRLKKRGEASTLTSELKGLEDTNKALKDKVEGLSREIQYLKDLLIEVRQLKGQIGTIQTE